MIATIAMLAAATVHPATEWAHEEFTNYTTRIFGAAPEVRFVLPDETDDFAADFKALKGTDGYAVRTRDKTIVFVADNPKGHVNGVHRWLERNSDIIWPRPAGDLCFYTPACQRPRREDASGTVSDYREVPAFRIRYLGSISTDREIWRWKVRNATTSMIEMSCLDDKSRAEAAKYGMYGIFGDSFGAGHSMERQWFPRTEFYKDHPEYYMLAGGVRGKGASCNFCETNPDLPEAYAKSVLEKLRDLPETTKIINVMMEDTSVTCQCEECMKPIRLPDGTVLTSEDPAFRSTRFFVFFNRIARLIGKARPDLRIRQYAYQHLSVPPKVKIEPNVTVVFCPYPRNMKESVIEGPSNRKWRERTDEWLANTGNLYWREYYFCGCIYFPRPIAETVAVDLRYLRDHGVPEVYCDSPGRMGDKKKSNNRTFGLNRPYSQYFDMNAMEAWVVAKLFWDPNQDAKELRHRFLTRTFGPAADEVARFYSLIHGEWNGDPAPSRYDDNPFQSAAHYIVGKRIDRACTGALEKAEALADRPERKAWIADMRAMLAEWIREASSYSSSEFRIPFAKEAKDAAQFPILKLTGSPAGADATRSAFRIRSTGQAFEAEVRVNKPFVEGDRAEICFAPVKGGRFAFPLEVKAKDKTGWTASATIPFSAANYAPHVQSKVKVLPRLLLKSSPKASPLDFTWLGAMPYKPEEWGTAYTELEF